jgi:hypothetical protein
VQDSAVATVTPRSRQADWSLRARSAGDEGSTEAA